jgi:hypothetical protein
VRWWLLAAGAVVVCAVSVWIVPSLGYDAWGWMTWGREIAHLNLNTLSGPSWKPLPALVTAPISFVAGEQTPYVWLFLVRLGALAALALAFIAARDLALCVRPGRASKSAAEPASDPSPRAVTPALATFAGLVAVIILGTSTDLVKTAMYGSSEPLLSLCALGAVVLHLRGRPLWAIGSLALAGLMRPEAWVITGLYALWLLWSRPAGVPIARTRVVAVLATIAPPLVWFGLDWLGSGQASQSASTAQHLTAGSAARAAFPAGEVLLRATDTLILPALILIAITVVLAIRRRDRLVLALIGASLIWIALVALQAQLGFTGDRRYLATAAAVLSVVAGVGAAWLVALLPGAAAAIPSPAAGPTAAAAPGLSAAAAPGLSAAAAPEPTVAAAPGSAAASSANSQTRGFGALGTVLAGLILVVLLASSIVPLRSNARQISVAREGVRQLDELKSAIRQAGGADAVLARGSVVVNPWIQTSLAYALDAHIARVTAAWSSTQANPRWEAPAILFIAPRHFAGTRPAIPPGTTTSRVGVEGGRWKLYVVR